MRWCAAALAAACAHATPPPPRPDLEAVQEATHAAAEEPPFVSPRAYLHYLEALLARDEDDVTTATRELREALVYSPDSPHLHTQLAELLVRQGRIADSEEELRSALQLDPAHAPALLLSARIALARGKQAEAYGRFIQAARAAPDEPDAYRELVRLALADGDLRGANAWAAELAGHSAQAQQRAQAEQRDDSPEVRGEGLVQAERLRAETALAEVDIGRAEAKARDDAAAQAHFDAALAADPQRPEALAAEAAFFESRRRFADARALELRLLSQRPEAPDVLAALLRLALEEGDLDSVAAHARKLRDLSRELGEAGSEAAANERRELGGSLLRAAMPLLGARRSAEALSTLDAAARLFPRHPELIFYRGIALVQLGRAREGARAFEAAGTRAVEEPSWPPLLGIDPAALQFDALVQAALAASHAGEKEQAVRRLRELFATRPTDEGASLALLEALDRAGRAADAEPLFAAAAREHPGDPGLLYALGSAQDRRGAREAAVATMRRVLAVAPEHAGALNYVGYSLAEAGELPESYALLSRAVELRPDDGAVADSFGYCLLRLGRSAEALQELTRADRLAPGDPVILSHLGDALLAAGKRSAAHDTFRRALERLAPRAPPAVERAQALASDPPDRLPEPGDARVREELLGKLHALGDVP